MSERTVVLQRKTRNKVNSQKIAQQIDNCVSRALSGPVGNCWDCDAQHSKPKHEGEFWVFNCTLTFNKISGRSDSEENQWRQILDRLVKKGKSAPFTNYPWLVVSGSENVQKQVERIISSDKNELSDEDKPVFNYEELGMNRDNHFDHLFDRDHQIDIVHSTIKAAIESEFKNRFHAVLYGPAGCGKTDILLSTAEMLGQEGSAYIKFDATSMTEAGVSKLLLENDFIPPVMIIEEAEKTDEKSLRWLLGILDQRGEIRRTNYRIGNQMRKVNMLCLATVNDINLFRHVMSGALASRFSHQIYCPRPSKEVLGKILYREVKKVNGNSDWIQPTLDFCVDEMHDVFDNDPRKIIPICLCGRDDLLDGSYQEAIRQTTEGKHLLHLQKKEVA